jgi:hypothetical protein
MPKVNWQRNLPMFKDEDGDDVALHMVRFHMHARKLKFQFPKDCLLNMFMATLEGKAWSWYESLPPTCIYSLKDFHSIFFEKYRQAYPSLLLIEDCCDHFENFIQELESVYGDEEFMDDELLEDFNENLFQHHERIMDSTLDDSEIEHNPNDDSYLTSSEIDDNLKQSSHSFNKQDIYEDGHFSFSLFIDGDQNSKFICIETLENNVSSIQFNNSVHRVCSFEPDEHFQQFSND